MPADHESILIPDFPFHPVVLISLILSLAMELERRPDAPLLKNMNPHEKRFLQTTLSHALRNAEQHMEKTGDSL